MYFLRERSGISTTRLPRKQTDNSRIALELALVAPSSVHISSPPPFPPDPPRTRVRARMGERSAGETHRIVPAVFGALGVGATGRDEVTHREMIGKLETVSHVGLPPSEHWGIHRHREGGVPGRQRALHELGGNFTVLGGGARTRVECEG